jgi:hypothetical protein
MRVVAVRDQSLAIWGKTRRIEAKHRFEAKPATVEHGAGRADAVDGVPEEIECAVGAAPGAPPLGGPAEEVTQPFSSIGPCLATLRYNAVRVNRDHATGSKLPKRLGKLAMPWRLQLRGRAVPCAAPPTSCRPCLQSTPAAILGKNREWRCCRKACPKYRC